MEFKKNEKKLWLEDESGRTVAVIDFPKIDEETVDITHTFVDGSLTGQGIAGKMTEALAEELRKQGKQAVLSCSYSSKWFAMHREYEDVLKDPEKEYEKAEMLAGPACGIKRG